MEVCLSMKIDMEKWAGDIIADKKKKVLPILFFPVVPEANQSMYEVVHNAPAHFEVMKEVIATFPDMIASMTGMDLTTEADTFGCHVDFTEDAAPSTPGEIVKDRESVEKLAVPSVQEKRAPVFLEAARLASEHFTDRPVFGGVLGPFSLAAVLMGLTGAVKTLMKDPETMHILLEKSTDYIISYAQAFKDAGANGILLAEPTAGLLSPAQCHEFSSKYVKRLVDAVQDQFFFIILHNCGNVTKMVDSMVSTGSKGYSFGNVVDMREILPQTPENVLVFGNISPSKIMIEEDPAVIKADAAEVLEQMRPYGRFVLASGCDMPMGTPLANIQALFEAVGEYNQKIG